MTSSIKQTLCAVIVLFSTNAIAKVAIYPTTGLNLNASPDHISQGSLLIHPDSDEKLPVLYRLSSFQVKGLDVDKSLLKIKSRYSSEFEPLDKYIVVLSGQEKSNPIKVDFKFKPTWLDVPGVYTGVLTANINANERINSYNLDPLPEIPIKIAVNSKTILSLTPAIINIATSGFESPVDNEVKLSFASNSPRWDLYVSIKRLANQSGKEISKDRIYVRVVDKTNPKSWLRLDQPIKILSGHATAPIDLATLEFLIDSKKTDKAGNYLGEINFLVKDDY
jgi:hypothetical protein